MKKLSTLLVLLCFFLRTEAQTATSVAVYQILQGKCATCHNHASPEAGLDLEGVGATLEDRTQSIRDNIVGATPANAYAVEKGYQHIYPGRTDKSFLFRKINKDLEHSIILSAESGASMPPVGEPELSEEEKELIRQWIVFGAPDEGEVVDPQVVYDYYHVNGVAAFDTPPPAPDPSEGYQVKIGPFFLNPAGEPGSELEYFSKYELDLPAATEVNRMDLEISSFSHHLVVYHYTDPEAASTVPPGLRVDTDHNNINIITTAQEAAIVDLPEGTAFMWEEDIILDLNTHYINYSASTIYKAEAYINIYTQPEGTAAQTMHTTLVPYPWIYIPNNGNPISFTNEIVYPEEIYLWAIGGHTHQLGTGYKAWERTENGEQGTMLYDAACAGGNPGCASPYFDYQHIPVRILNPLRKIDLSNGLIHEATFLNDGPNPVWWGSTSEDEMMLMGLMYVLDTTGLELEIVSPTYEPNQNTLEGVEVYPNPVDQKALFELPPTTAGAYEIQLFDLLGNEVHRSPKTTTAIYHMNRGNLSGGMYFYRVTDGDGKWQSGKLFFQ